MTGTLGAWRRCRTSRAAAPSCGETMRAATTRLVEATAALAMLLLEDHGVLTVHFAGLPPGTSTLLFKFIPPETLARFGGPDALAKAVDASLSKLASLIGEPEKIRILLVGGA